MNLSYHLLQAYNQILYHPQKQPKLPNSPIFIAFYVVIMGQRRVFLHHWRFLEITHRFLFR
jgi:hypothetical protein